MEQEELVNDEAFSRIFWSHVIEMPHHKGFALNRILYSLRFSIRIWSDKPHTMISRKVAEHFIRSHPKSNPFGVKWTQRKKYGVMDNGKSLLVLEHTTPVNILSTALSKAQSLDEVKALVTSYSGVCMVTRGEDDMLTSKGYVKNRPNGWKSAYEECGIDVLDEKEYILLLNQLSSSPQKP